MKTWMLLLFITFPLYAFSPISDVYSKEAYQEQWKEILKQKQKREYVEVIMKTISWAESGGNYNAMGASGDHGKYQILKSTWRGWCKIYFGKQLEMTPENQDSLVNVVISDWVEKGLTVEQIAAKWNSGSHVGWKTKVGINKYGVPYDVPKYVENFVHQYKIIKTNT